MPRSRTNGVEIYYQTAGEGPPLVLIHAIPFDHDFWLYQTAHFSTWFKVIAVDIRGWGRSEKVTTAFSLKDMCDDVWGVCQDLGVDGGVDEAVVMGCSIGSKMALMLGLDHPETFKAVVLVGGNSGPQDMDRRVEGYLSEELAPYRADHLRHGERDAFNQSHLGRHLLQTFSERNDWLDNKAIAEVFRALGAADVRDRLGSFRTPTLIINGEFDSARAGGTRTAGLIAGAVQKILPAMGHACNLEDPAGFDEVVINFLTEQGLMPPLAP
ncbi:MAG: alpha/beta hydrolase [Alphaproteobacteria bacterium]